MLAIVTKTHDSAKKVQLRLLASCAMATSMLSAGVAQAGTEIPPLTGANTSFQGTATVVSGSANIVQTATMDTITVSTPNTVINFTPFDTANGGGPITFLPAGRTGLFVNDPANVTNFTVLNRIIPADPTRAIRFDGTVQSRIADGIGGTTPGGTILFYSPGGILASSTSVFDVGSLVLTAADVNLMGSTLSFNGAAAGSAVDINAGASILAQGAGSYVALVAPRIIQSGSVKSDGSVAYIGAEAVDVTIQNNLFDINFVQGTDGVDGSAVTHTGTTELTRAAGDATPQRVYVAAVPKNTAITSLVSGTLGYTAATDAMVQDGVVILSAGRNIVDSGANGVAFNDLANPPAAASLTIGADTSTVFNASLLTNATGDAIIAPASGLTVTFNDDVTLTADRLAEVRAVAGSSAVFGANLSVVSANNAMGAAARVVALGNAGPTPATGQISVAGNLNVDGGEGLTAMAALTADLGHISVNGSTSLLARTDRSLGLGGNGNATGGTAAVTIGAAGSQLTLNSLTVDASAKAGIGIDGNENPVPGNALGGTSSLSIGGGTFLATGVSFDSSASANPGGSATGGTVNLNATGGTSSTGTITISTAGKQIDSLPDRTGPVSPTVPSPLAGMMPATVTGGTVQLNVINTTMNIDGNLVLDASVASQTGAGNLLGGTIGINVDNGRLLVGDEILADASAEETASSLGVDPGLVRGGMIMSSSINNGTILSSASSYSANAMSGGDTQGGSVTVQTMTGGSISSIGQNSLGAAATTRGAESAGDATGGTLLVNITSGEFVSGPLVLDASAVGGDAVMSGIGGSATGGSATVNISGGDSTIDLISLTTDATGGQGGPAAATGMAGGNGGSATGGNAEVNLLGGSLQTAGFNVTSMAMGGDGGDGDTGGHGGSATGGRAAILTSPAATLELTRLPSSGLSFNSLAASSATGGNGGSGSAGTGGNGGIAAGGTSILTLAGAQYLPAETPFAVTVDTRSSATGGSGGASIGGNAGSGGNATGGSAALTLSNNLVMFGDALTDTSASGGQGGNAQVGYGGPFMGGAGGSGSGGAASISIAAPTASMAPINIVSLSATSNATGGNGGTGDLAGVGGTAVNGGSAAITQNAGATSIGSLSASAGAVTTGPLSNGGIVSVSVGPEATLVTTALTASSNAVAGLGSAKGGIVNLVANDGALSSATSIVSADGSSIVSGTETGGRGGLIDVQATTSMGGSTASLSLGTTSLTANGRSTPTSGMGAPSNALAGRINLSSIGSQATSISFSSLSAATLGQTSGMMSPTGGIFLTADQGSLAVIGAATIVSDESVDVLANGSGNLFVGSDLVVNARNLISVSHSNRVMGTQSILAASATFTSGGNFSALSGTSLRADTDLSISSTLGSVTANDLNAGDDISINAGYGVTLNGLVQTTGMPMMGESSDISIDSPGAVSVNMIDAAGNFSVSADSFTSNGLVTAGEDINISTTGAITTQTVSAGDDVMASSIGGDISVASAIARGNGPDNDMRGADVRLQSTSGAISLNSAMSHDDIFVTSLGNITASNLSASGMGGLGNRNGIIVDSAGAVTLNDVSSQHTIAVRGASVAATQFTAGEDIAILASDGLSAMTATAGDDFMATSAAGNVTLSSITTNGKGPDDRTVDFGYGGIGILPTAADGSNITASAGYGSLTLGTLSASNDLVAEGNSIVSMASSNLSAGRDLTLAAQSAIGIKSANAGRDLSATTSAGLFDAISLTAGDDISVSATGLVSIINATSTGLASSGYGMDTSDISINGATAALTTISAADNLSVSATEGVEATSLLAAKGAINVNGGASALIGSVTATLGSATISADATDVTTLSSGGNASVNFVGTGSVDTAVVGGELNATGIGNFDFTSLTSTGSTTISAGGSVTGGSASAGSLLSITATSVDADSLTSTGSDVTVNADIIDLLTVSAGRDAVFTTTAAPASMITLGTASAGRDIMINGGTAGVTATTLMAGDDISLLSPGTANITTATTTGANMGYGGDTSDINLTANTLMLGMIQAQNNLGLVATTSLSADRLATVMGNINASAGTTATIAQTMANGGSATISADSVNLTNTTASNDVTVTHGASASLGTVMAGNAITVTGTGNSNFTSLTSTGATTISAGGSVTGGSASAGSLLTVNASSVTAENLTSRNDSVMVTAGSSTVTTGSAAVDLIISTGMAQSGSITLTSGTAGRDVKLLSSGGSVSVTDAIAGDDIVITTGGAINSTGSLRTTGLGRGASDSDVDLTAGSTINLNLVDAFTDISVLTAPGGTMIASGLAGDDINVNVAGDVNANLLRTTGAQASGTDSDIMVTSTGMVMVNVANAASDFESSAASFSGNNLTAGEDIEINTQGSASVMSALSGDDTIITSASGAITLGSANANGVGPDDEDGGSDVRLTATTGTISVGSASAGDEIDFTAGGSIMATSLTSAGINPDGDRSNVLIDSGADVTLGTVDANATIAIRAASLTADMLTAGEDVAIQTTGSASVANASAGDDFMITSSTGPITLGTISTLGAGLDDRTVDFGYGEIGFLATPTDGSRIVSNAVLGDIAFTSLTSTGETSLFASGNVNGGTAAAGGLLSVTAAAIDVDSLTSTGSDVTVNAELIDIMNVSAGRDALFTTLTVPTSMISLGTVSAGRDIMINGGTSGVTAMSLSAGDDISLLSPGTANIISATTTGANMGYGGDTSDIDFNANQLILGTLQAKNNLTLTSATSLDASQLTTMMGNISATAATSANVTQTMADGGFASFTADLITLPFVTATGNVNVNHGASAILGSVMAGGSINVSGDGNSSFDSLDSTGTTSIFAGGNVTGGNASAGGLLTVNASSLTATNLTSLNDSVIVTALESTVSLGSAAIDLVISTGRVPRISDIVTPGGSITLSTGLAGRDVLLLSSGTVSVVDATAGDDIVINAGGAVSSVGTLRTTGLNADLDRSNVFIDTFAGVMLGTVNANASIAIRGLNQSANMLTAGEDVAIETTDIVSVTNASAGDDFMVTSATGSIALGTIETLGTGLDDRAVDFGYGAIGFTTTAANGSRIDVTATTGDILLTELNSAGETHLSANGSVNGGTASAGGLLSVSASSVDTISFTSIGSDVTVDADNIDVTSTSAGRDAVFTTSEAPTSSITLGAVTANRDILITGATGGLNAIRLTAGDDIFVMTPGLANIGQATTMGTNVGYGAGPSDIMIDALSAEIGTARARDNVFIDTVNGTNASNMIADRGSITVNGGTLADIGNASAVLGSIGINAELISADFVSAGVDVNVDFVTNASLGSVTAGRDVGITGTGDANADSISAGRDLNIMVVGDLTVGSGSAGRNLRNSSANFSATNLMAGADIVVLTDESADLGTASARGRIVTNAGTSIAFTNLNSGLSTSLVAGTAIAGGNATAGTTLSLNANGGGISFGTLSSGANTTLTAQAQISGISASAGGALTIDSSSVGVSASSLSAGANSNLTVTASNGGNATIGSASAGRDVSVNATNVAVTAGTATRDVIYAASRMINAGTTTAGRDIRFTAGSNIVSDIANATGLISANSVGNSQLNTSSADNIFVVASGDTTIGSASAGTFIGINTNDVVATTLTAGEDIRLIASGTANVTSATAGDDVDISAAMGGTLGNIRATATARDDRNLEFNAPSFTIVNAATDGSEARISSNGSITVANIDVGDDIRVATGNFTLSGTATTRGLGSIESGSDVIINAAAASVGTVNAANNIFNNSISFAANMLRANGTINVVTAEDSSLGTANAVQGPISASSARGTISFADLSTNGDIFLSSGGSIRGGNAQAGGFVGFSANNVVDFDSIVSGFDTSIFGDTVIGGTISASSSVSIGGDFIDIGNISSDFGSIFLSGRDINIGTAGARFDFIVRGDGESVQNERITLGDIVAGRDILLSGASDQLTANSLMAGDDIEIDILGKAKIGLAITDGSFDGGYGGDGYGDVARPIVKAAVNSGYGGVDESNILLMATQSMIGRAQADDNVTITTSNGTMAGTIIADNGDILVNGGSLAQIDTASAPFGSVDINATQIDAGNVTAAINVTASYENSASFDNVNAGNQISISGIGNLDFGALVSGATTTITSQSGVDGGSVNAGQAISINADTIDVDSLTSSGSSIFATATDIDIGNANAFVDVIASNGKASEGTISLGTITAGRDIALSGGDDGIFATSLTAGDDIVIAGNGEVVIENALTSGAANSGYGEDGYGNGTSDIVIGSISAMIGTAQAKDNLTLATENNSRSDNLIADLGAIRVDGGANVSIGSATATSGSVTINADSLSADSIDAATFADISFGDEATLGSVDAGDNIAINGDGDLDYVSLNSGSATALTAGGDITGGAATAGTSFTANADGDFEVGGATAAGSTVTISADSIGTANVSSGTTTSLTATRSITTANVMSGTGVTLRAGTNAATGALSAQTNNVSVTAQTGMNIGSANAVAGDVSLANTAGAVVTGALSAGNDVTVANGGAINIMAATATDDVRVSGSAAITVGTATTVGGADRDNDGNDIVIAASGPVSVTTATTQRSALSSSDIVISSMNSSANVGSATALSNVNVSAATSLTAGTVGAGANIALTGQTINATDLAAARNLTTMSTGATTIGNARATGGNLNLTAGGNLSATSAGALGDVRLTTSNGGNVTTGTLSSGSAFVGGTSGGQPGAGDVIIGSDGNISMTGNTNAGRNLALTAKTSVAVGGVTSGVDIDIKSTDIIINSQNGRIGEQGRTTQLKLTNTGTGTTTIGGAGVSGSYSLANAEAQRLFAGDIIIAATSTGDTILDALSLTGANGQTGATAGNIGSSGRLRIETPGKLKTIGAVSISNLTNANRFQINAAQNIEVDAATGSISLSRTGGTPGGTLEMTAPLIVAASAAATTEVAALTEGRAINDRLAINDGAISDAGNFSADTIIVNVSNAFLVQNSGIKELSAFSFGDRRGITVGAGGLIINAASPSTRIFVSGRQLQANGNFLTGVDFVRRQTINGTVVQLSIFPPTPFDPASTVNGCAIINSATCLINVDGGSLARDVVGQSDEDSGGSGNSGSSSDANFVQFQFKNLDEANFQPVIDDPVTGVGNDDLWALYDAKACADDQSLDGCTPQ